MTYMCRTHVCVLLYTLVHVQTVVSKIQEYANLQQAEQGLTWAHHTCNGSLLRSIVVLLQLFPQTVRHSTASATTISHATVIHADHTCCKLVMSMTAVGSSGKLSFCIEM